MLSYHYWCLLWRAVVYNWRCSYYPHKRFSMNDYMIFTITTSTVLNELSSFRTLVIIISACSKNKTNNKSLPNVGTKEERKEKGYVYLFWHNSWLLPSWSTLCGIACKGSKATALFLLRRQKGVSGCGVYLLFRLPRHWAYYVGGPKPSWPHSTSETKSLTVRTLVAAWLDTELL